MASIEVERWIEHPVDHVFRRYTDHEGWSRWASLGQVRIVQDGSPDRNGVGCVRAFSSAPGLREEVTAFEPPRRMDYRILKGLPLITDHRGEVLFEPERGGTRVTWRVSFRPRLPGTGWVIERGLKALFKKVLASLAWDLNVPHQPD